MDHARDNANLRRSDHHPKKLILAAAHAARKKAPPPQELQLAWNCQNYSSLPKAGGILDQPAGLLERMTAALNTYNSCKAFSKNSSNVEWMKENGETIEFMSYLEQLEKDGTELN